MKVIKFKRLNVENNNSQRVQKLKENQIKNLANKGCLFLQVNDDPKNSIGTVLMIDSYFSYVLITDDICFTYGFENVEYYTVFCQKGKESYIKLVDENGENITPFHSNISKASLLDIYKSYINSLHFDENDFETENIPTVQVRYHKELYPDMMEIGEISHGDFIDLRSAERVELKAGEFKIISLGVSIKLPEGYWAQFVPRSSTFKNYGILQTNSFAVIDESYCGDNDIWRMAIYATRDTVIEANDRVCQFRIVKKQPFKIESVDHLDGEDRGGFGSTGKV